MAAATMTPRYPNAVSINKNLIGIRNTEGIYKMFLIILGKYFQVNHICSSLNIL